MRGNAAEERMGREARRVIKGVGHLISGRKSKPVPTRQIKHRRHKPTESERQGAFKEKMRKNRRV